MKYFINTPYTAETLKAEFRALCLTMHPDRGGNAEEFKAMQNEYEEVTNNLQRINEEAEAREEMKRAAEEARRRREQEEREEEARKAAARPEYERKCNKWAHLMEDLTSYKEAEAAARKNYGWSSQEAKAAGNAYRAARRRNLVAMAKAAFPGVKFTASINTGWGGGATISWNEGPTVEEFKAATNYEIFVSGWDTFDGMTDCAGYEHAMFTEFANNYGQFSGCVSYDRTEEKEHREEVADIICSVKPSAAEQRARDGRREDCTVFLSDEEIVKICSLLGIDADKFKKAHQIYSTYGESKYFELFVEWFTKWSHYTPQPKAPEFVPKYGKTYKAIKKALGSNVFGYRKGDIIADIFALCDDLAGLEIGKIFVWEGKKEFSGMYSSNYKNTAARIEKMQAVGITLDRAGEKVQAVAEEVREALRRERQDIERQRQEWEAEQRGEKKAEKPAEKAEKPRKERKPTESKQDSQKPATANETAADGLTMEQYSEKATVIRGYNAEQAAELEEMGGKEWRNLRGGKGYIFSTRRHGDKLAEWFAAQQAEGTAPAAEPATLESGQDITAPASEETAAPFVPEFVALGSGLLVLSRNRVGGSGLVVRGYNAQQFADLQAMGGTYNPHLQSGPGVIFRASEKAAEVCAYIEAQELARLSKPQELPTHTETETAYICHAAQTVSHDTAETIEQGDRVIYNQFNGEAMAGEVVAVALPHYFVKCDNGQAIACKRADLVRVPRAADFESVTAPAFGHDVAAIAREQHPEWPEEFTTEQFYNTPATDEHGRRIKTADEIKEQARRIECNYLAGRGSLRDTAHRLERTKGADHPDTLAAYERLQSRARYLRAAELEAHRTAGERRRAAWMKEHRPGTLEQGGEITAPKAERMKTRGEVFAQYFRILNKLTDGKKWESETNRDRADRILKALNRYADNFAKVPEIARLYSHSGYLEDGTDPAKAANLVPVARSLYMGLRRPLAKSAKQIQQQAQRIIDAAALASWNGKEYERHAELCARLDRVSAISDRYIKNICDYFGEKAGYLANNNYGVPVYRDIYAAA